MKHTNTSLTAHLQKMLDDVPSPLEHAVISFLIDSEQPLDVLKDLLQYGCKSGMVPNLVYYADTYQFCDTHYLEIMDLYHEHDIVIPAQTNVKNFLAWWSFETVAYKIACDLGIYY